MSRGGYFCYPTAWYIRTYITLVIEFFLLQLSDWESLFLAKLLTWQVIHYPLFVLVHIILSADNDHFFISNYLNPTYFSKLPWNLGCSIFSNTSFLYQDFLLFIAWMNGFQMVMDSLKYCLYFY